MTKGTTRADALRNQNEQVVTFSLVELLTQLLFMAMALALVLQQEALRDLNPTAEAVRDLRRQLEERDATIRQLRQDLDGTREELANQEALVRKLLGTKGVTLPSEDVVAISRVDFQHFANLKGMLEERQAETVTLRRQLAQVKGGSAIRPVCLVTSGSLVIVHLTGDGGFRTQAGWSAGAATEAAGIPGVAALIGRPLQRGTFNQAASRVAGWGNGRPQPCAFRATVIAEHSNLTLYLRQLAAVEQWFYVRRSR